MKPAVKAPVRAVFRFGVCALMAVALVAGCEEDDDGEVPAASEDDGSEKSAEPKPSATTVELTPPTSSPTGKEKPAIVARVKAEVDGKEPDGPAGASLIAPGAKAVHTVPNEWKRGTSGASATANEVSDKAMLASSALGSSAPDSKAGDVAAGLGLTDCSWGTSESAAVGKDKLAATVADGVCLKGDDAVRTAFVAIAELDSIAVGAWPDQGGDATPVFQAFRSVKKAASGGPGGGVAACCSAIDQNMKSAPPGQEGAYKTALGLCNALINNPQGMAALNGVRAALQAQGAKVPPLCQ